MLKKNGRFFESCTESYIPFFYENLGNNGKGGVHDAVIKRFGGI